MKKYISIILIALILSGCSKNKSSSCIATLSDTSDVKVKVEFKAENDIVNFLEKETIINISNYSKDTLLNIEKNIENNNISEIYGVDTKWNISEKQLIRLDKIDFEKASISSLIEWKFIPSDTITDNNIISYKELVKSFQNHNYSIVEKE